MGGVVGACPAESWADVRDVAREGVDDEKLARLPTFVLRVHDTVERAAAGIVAGDLGGVAHLSRRPYRKAKPGAALVWEIRGGLRPRSGVLLPFEESGEGGDKLVVEVARVR